MPRAVDLLMAPLVVFATGVLGFFGLLLALALGPVIMAVSLVWAGCMLWAGICAIAWAAGFPGAPARLAWAMAASAGSFGVLALLCWPVMALWAPMPKPAPDAPFIEAGSVELRR